MSKRLSIKLDARSQQIIDDWRRIQTPLPNFNQAVNDLIHRNVYLDGLVAEMQTLVNDLRKKYCPDEPLIGIVVSSWKEDEVKK